MKSISASKRRVVVLCLSVFCVCVFSFIGYRAWKHATFTSRPKLGSNGRQIHLALFDKSMEAVTWEETIWPKSGQYESSTEFFRAMVTNKWIQGVDFTFFGWQGLKHPADVSDPMSFKSENNAWCIVEGLNSNTPPDTPCVFTRNIGFGPSMSASTNGTTLDQMTGLNKNQLPLRDKVSVIVTFDGRVKILPLVYANQTNFNPNGSKLTILAP